MTEASVGAVGAGHARHDGIGGGDGEGLSQVQGWLRGVAAARSKVIAPVLPAVVVPHRDRIQAGNPVRPGLAADLEQVGGRRVGRAGLQRPRGGVAQGPAPDREVIHRADQASGALRLRHADEVRVLQRSPRRADTPARVRQSRPDDRHGASFACVVPAQANAAASSRVPNILMRLLLQWSAA